MTDLSVPTRCAAFLHPAFRRSSCLRAAFLPAIFRRPAFRRQTFPCAAAVPLPVIILEAPLTSPAFAVTAVTVLRGAARGAHRGVLCGVLAVALAPTVGRPLVISRAVFGGLLRRSEPSPIATAAARRAVIGCRGGRSVHGLPRLERLSIVFALPQFGMCPQFPRTASEYPIDQSCPGNTLHSGHTSRSSGTAHGLLLRSVPPGPGAPDKHLEVRARRTALPLSWRASCTVPPHDRPPPEAAVPLNRTRPYPQYLNPQPLYWEHLLRAHRFP